MVRQKFPKITTRRLGTRGQSKYHYYGIGIRRTSIYFEDEVNVTNQNINNRYKFSAYDLFSIFHFQRIISREKIRTKCVNNRKESMRRDNKPAPIRSLKASLQILPQMLGSKPQLRHFPRTSEFVIPADVRRDQLSTFLLMYRSHCQRVLDTFLMANSEDICKYLSHFWSGIPQHLFEVLSHPFMECVIECADSVLYSVSFELNLVNVLLHKYLTIIEESSTFNNFICSMTFPRNSFPRKN